MIKTVTHEDTTMDKLEKKGIRGGEAALIKNMKHKVNDLAIVASV